MSEFKSLNELYEKFKAPFPKEAYQKDSSRGFDLTSVKAQYIVERLNESVGFNNWRLDGKFSPQEDGSVLYEGALILFLGEYGNLSDGSAMIHQIPTVGFAKKGKNLGDTYKSSKTDALSKACSYIGIANEVFKGNVNTDGSEKKGGKKPTAKPPTVKQPTTKKVADKKPETFKGKKPSDF